MQVKSIIDGTNLIYVMSGTNICTIWFTYLYYENMVQFFIPFSGVEFQFIERYPNIVRILGGYMHDMPPIHFPPELVREIPQ